MGKRDLTRRSFTAEQKAAILQRHFAEKVPVSDLCDEYKLQPSLFYAWQRQALENLAAALERRGRGSAKGGQGQGGAGGQQAQGAPRPQG